MASKGNVCNLSYFKPTVHDGRILVKPPQRLLLLRAVPNGKLH